LQAILGVSQATLHRDGIFVKFQSAKVISAKAISAKVISAKVISAKVISAKIKYKQTVKFC